MMIWVRLLRGWGAPGSPLEVRLLHPLVRLVLGVRLVRVVRHLHPCFGCVLQGLLLDQNEQA